MRYADLPLHQNDKGIWYFEDWELAKTHDYTLHCGDCLDIMPTLEAGSIDAIICDPPYNVGFKYTSHDDNNALYEQWCQSWFYELKRICNGPIAISVGQTNLSMWARIAPPDWC